MRFIFILMLIVSIPLLAKKRLPRAIKPERVYQIQSFTAWKKVPYKGEDLQIAFKQVDCCRFGFQLIQSKDKRVLISGDLEFEFSARDRRWGPSSSRGKLFHVKNAFSPMNVGAVFIETRYLSGREQFVCEIIDWDRVNRSYVLEGFVIE